MHKTDTLKQNTQRGETIMNKIITVAVTLLVIGFSSSIVAPVQAAIINVTGPNSTSNNNTPNTAPAIVSPPSDVLNNCVTNTGQQGFNEAQGVTTTQAYTIDGGTILAGTVVNSHMIFLNQAATTGILSHFNVTWTFDTPIIGVMSDSKGNEEVASTPELGASSTNYTVTHDSCGSAAPFLSRGLESQAGCTATSTQDGYVVSGNTITVCMTVTQPGDWIRVITEGTVQIDIKPGSYPNCFNINGNGVIPVAILGSATFDVTEINTSSLSFAGLKVRVRANGPLCSTKDSNGDGFLDLVCQFEDDPANWAPGNGTATLTGTLNDNAPFEGTDSICVVS
jgi:hypothetical protein